MSIQSEIERINQAKTDLATAIESKGVTVPPNTTINVYPGLVQQIEQGAGLPSGGTPGQILYQGESGPEWGDKPVMYVNITESDGTYSADKTAQEIYEAFSDGCAVYAIVMSEAVIPIYNASFHSGVYSTVFSRSAGGVDTMIIITSETGVQIGTNNIGANKISFTPGTTGLSADNVQDALEELASRKGIFLVKAERQSGTLMADKTLSEIHQAIDDGLVPFLLYVSTSSFIPLYGTTDPTQSVMFVSNYGAYTTVYTVMSDQTITVTQTDSTLKRVTITLTASGWSSNTQTVTVTGVLADETKQLIQPMPAMASQSAYYGAEVLCSGQAANSLTFTCQNVPTEDLTVYVVMQEVGA